jgi:hypothetical protein
MPASPSGGAAARTSSACRREPAEGAYSLLDAFSYSGQRLLVVGGGDSAIEAALALSEQPGNEVTLSYRRESFFRITAANEGRLARALAKKHLRVLFRSQVRRIGEKDVELDVSGGRRQHARQHIPNDGVFVMAGGTAPFEILEHAGVSFDASQRAAPKPVVEQGTGLMRALGMGFLVSLLALAWALWHADYYTLSPRRAAHARRAPLPAPRRGRRAHARHRRDGADRRQPLVPPAALAAHALVQVGLAAVWMTSHVATGILGLPVRGAALRHGAGRHGRGALVLGARRAARDRAGSGATSTRTSRARPTAASSRWRRSRRRLTHLSEEWDQGQQRFREHARDAVQRLVDDRRWQPSFAAAWSR